MVFKTNQDVAYMGLKLKPEVHVVGKRVADMLRFRRLIPKARKKNRIKINEEENKCTAEKIQSVETGCLGNNEIIRTFGGDIMNEKKR